MPGGGVAMTGVSSFFQCSKLVVFGGGEHLRLAQFVVAVVQCCLGGRRILHAGVDNRGLAVEDHRRSAEAAFAVGPAGRGRKRDRLVMPVHHVRADGVSPMHVAPHRRVRIELIEEVVVALPPDGAVGVVHPIVRRKQMKFRPKRIVRDS